MVARLILIGFLLCNFVPSFAASDSVTVMGQFVNNTGRFPKEVTLVSVSDIHFQQTIPVGVYGQFKFTFARTAPSFYMIQVGAYANSFPVGESESVYRITIQGDANAIKDISVDDSKETDAFRALVNSAKMFDEALNEGARHCNADKSCYDSIMPQLKHIRKTASIIAAAYPATFAGKTLSRFFNFDVTDNPKDFRKNLQQQYLKQIPWSESTTYDNFFVSVVLTEYVRNFADTTPEGIRNFILPLFSQIHDTEVANKLFKLLFMTFSTERKEEALSGLNKLIQSKEIAVTDEVFKARLANLCHTLIGNTAIELNLKNASGKSVSLYQTAEATPAALLVFWSPSCSHCREEMPLVKSLYDKYHKRGLEVFAVAIDADSSEWNDFIHEQQLQWINVVYHHGENNDNVEKYSILHTPTFVVIDKNKKIVSRLALVSELEAVIKKML